MAATAILNPTAADIAIVDTLVPSTKGVPCGRGCVAIPSDWHARLLAGQRVDGCSYDIVIQNDRDSSLLVSDLAQSRMNNPAYNSGINAQNLSDFQARLNPFRICFLGDSITQGYNTQGDPCNGYRPGAASIADPRGRCVYTGMQYQTTSVPYAGANATAIRPTWYHSGVSGWHCDDHVAELFLYGTGTISPIYGTGGLQINPHIIFICIGTNDAGRLDSLSTFTTNYNNLVNGLHTNCPGAVFIGCIPPLYPRNGEEFREAQLATYRSALPGIWDNLQASGVNIVARCNFNILSAGSGPPYTSPYLPDFDLDGIHPNLSSGYPKLASAAGAALTTALTAIGGP